MSTAHGFRGVTGSGVFEPDGAGQAGGETLPSDQGVSDMAADEKAQAKTEQAKGKVKEAAGRAVGNERLTAEGRADQAKGDIRQAKEKVKDALTD